MSDLELDLTQVGDAGSGASVGPNVAGGDDQPNRAREYSTIEFPYVDLEQAMVVPDAIHRAFGTRGLPEQLSGALNLKGGAFRRRIAGAKMFGLIEKEGDHYKITELGRRTISAGSSAPARVEAFRKVELYEKLYNDFRGTSLPSEQGIENHMREAGVPEKQTDIARQIFRRSARQAGFFAFGEDRLILPALREENAVAPADPNGRSSDAGGKGDETPSGGDETTLAVIAALKEEIAALKAQQSTKSTFNPDVANLPPAVVGVLTTLPLTSADQWSDDDLDEWVTMFRTVIKRSFRDRITVRSSMFE